MAKVALKSKPAKAKAPAKKVLGLRSPQERAGKGASAKQVSPIPPGFHAITPHMVVRDAAGAIEFYKKALGAKERFRHGTPDGKIGHAEVQIGDSILMLSDEFPGMCEAPKGPVPMGIYLYIADVDKTYASAVKGGATAKMPVTDMFWGDRMGTFVDPFGHTWTVATHVRDVSPAEMEKGAAEHAKQHAEKSEHGCCSVDN
jgi:PhnB protein